uniref:Family S9 non peptidase ue S09 family n=1 Tax=Echinococcus granulosus TaxID=6210 RepID=A0A068WSR4_ECHGR|nr:family S9 non peptidase ue S09 family [Echinococcus granulosus]
MTLAGGSLWIDDILLRLCVRDDKESRGYKSIVNYYTGVRDRVFQLDVINARLERRAVAKFANSSELEQKLLNLQEEVINLHRQREKLQYEVREKQGQIEEQADRIKALSSLLDESNKINRSCMETIDQLKSANNTLLDEQTATALTVGRLEYDKRELVEDRLQCLAQITFLQKQIEDLKNSESDMRLQLQRELIHRGLLDAACMPLSVEEGHSSQRGRAFSSLPDIMAFTITTADDVNCVRISPSGKLLSYGGLDRKVWLCSIRGEKYDSQTSLVGCNAGVTAVDFDQEETMVLGASSDFACRVWTLADRRLKVNLTGHSDRVVAARFVDGGDAVSGIVTASYDRTIKLWNVGRRQCSRTILVTSLCYDILACPSTRSLVSGHSDKKIRIWDQESGHQIRETPLSGRITGLDVSNDGTYVLACTRNDTLHIVDLRQNSILKTFQAEDFHVHADCVRPCFSPDGTFVACGSQNGDIFVWNTNTGIVESILHGHDNMVICTHWSSHGTYMISCERGKKVIMWWRAE